jgi:hypothetical protein
MTLAWDTVPWCNQLYCVTSGVDTASVAMLAISIFRKFAFSGICVEVGTRISPKVEQEVHARFLYRSWASRVTKFSLFASACDLEGHQGGIVASADCNDDELMAPAGLVGHRRAFGRSGKGRLP